MFAMSSPLSDAHMPTNKHRVSINLADAEYAHLAALSEKGRVSMAWLAREALIEYLARHPESPFPSRLHLPAMSEAGR